VTAVAVAGVLLWEPWDPDTRSVESEQTWVGLQEFLGDSVPVPEAAAGIEIRSDRTALDSRRLVASAISTYENSTEFYDAATEEAAS